MKRQYSPEIVVTLGPASWDLAPQLHEAGASTFRLNASHIAVEELQQRAENVRKLLPDSELVIDLQGAKMRLGHFPERPVSAGERLRFSFTGEPGTVPLPHQQVFRSVTAGETLSCDDDRLQFSVESVGPGTLGTVSCTSGILRPRKGVNVLEHPVLLQDLSEVDLNCISATGHLGRLSFAFSFMRDGSEAEWIRRRAPGCSVVGKIERREAAENAHLIARAVDTVWVCRGDLGAQLGPATMARWIHSYDPRVEPCPVLMAGQVLEHLTCHSEPTRSEVCHLFDLVGHGYAGFVLSDETAIGHNPAAAVATLRNLLNSWGRGTGQSPVSLSDR